MGTSLLTSYNAGYFHPFSKHVASMWPARLPSVLSTQPVARLSTAAQEGDLDPDQCMHLWSSAKSEPVLLGWVLPSYSPWRGEKGCTGGRKTAATFTQ